MPVIVKHTAEFRASPFNLLQTFRNLSAFHQRTRGAHMSGGSQRLPFIDALKAVACQLIVLHHLAFYGPMSDSVSEIAPGLVAWLSDHARIAVQVFLVTAGFLAAKALAPQGMLRFASPLALIRKRYLRLVIPYALVLALAIVAAALAREWMQHESIPAEPTATQIIAHLLLLNDVAGFDALSAGVWYVAIDFQLFVLMLCALWLAQRLQQPTADAGLWPGPALVMALGCASLFVFNRDPVWDTWGLYFFGTYAMGATAFWASDRTRPMLWIAVLALPVLAALAVDFRLRIAVALLIALSLAFARRSNLLYRWPQGRLFAFLGRIAYSVFLVHFPICLLVNAACVRFLPQAPWISAAGMLTAWLASIAGGALFYRVVEGPVRSRIAGPALLAQPA